MYVIGRLAKNMNYVTKQDIIPDCPIDSFG